MMGPMVHVGRGHENATCGNEHEERLRKQVLEAIDLEEARGSGVGDVGRGADGGDGQASGEVALPTAPSLPFSVCAVKTVPTPTCSIACSSRTEESPPATAASTSPRRSAARVADVARVRRTRYRKRRYGGQRSRLLQKVALWQFICATAPIIATHDRFVPDARGPAVALRSTWTEASRKPRTPSRERNGS